MNKYTVLLLYPDYLAQDYGEDTYLAWVEANTVNVAVKKAQLDVSSQIGSEEELFANPEDFFVLFVAKGHIEDLTPQQQPVTHHLRRNHD